ncbi:hypothetical protein [Helcococcus ovis]|uniref:hypothetical protein n=1 Tax=Helcococcus ovis TaxID=72026 RepID=UPI0038B8BC8F
MNDYIAKNTNKKPLVETQKETVKETIKETPKPEIKKGWEKKADDKWYFTNDKGELVKSDWIYDNNYSSWYYLNENGDMATNKWVKNTNSKWYYLLGRGTGCQGY